MDFLSNELVRGRYHDGVIIKCISGEVGSSCRGAPAPPPKFKRLFLVSISASLHVQIHAVVSLHAHFSEVSLK